MGIFGKNKQQNEEQNKASQPEAPQKQGFWAK